MYREIEVTPISAAVGAEIRTPEVLSDRFLFDVDPESEELRSRIVAEIHDAWLQYHLVVFRDLSLTPAALAALCSLFGELDTYPFVEPTAEHPNVIPVVKEAVDTENFGGAWHTDTSYMEKPPKATCLYALDVPEQGGDTLFANTSTAFSALSPGMQAMIENLKGNFTPRLVHGANGPYAGVKSGGASKDSPEFVDSYVQHPVIRTHPQSGVKSIYATPLHCESFENMTREESLPLLNYLYEFATKDCFTARLKWRKGTLAMWDNRCLFHNALNDYQGQRREMHRVTLKGGRPA